MTNIRLTSCAICIIAILFLVLLGSCTKQAADVPALPVAENSIDAATTSSSEAISKAIDPKSVLGTYTARNEKTIFIGQANASGTNVLIHLLYLDMKKKIEPTADQKHLTTPYSATDTYLDAGWAYIIGYNRSTKQITLQPNDAMKAGIVPGSFKTMAASYFPNTGEWTFVTRFTPLTNNNEVQVSENYFR